MGVWGPLAAASIYKALVVLIRMFASNGSEMKLPSLGDILNGWALPMMSQAVREDEKSNAAKELFDNVKRLKERFEK